MNAKLVIDVPAINWACTYLLDEEKVQSAGRGKHNAIEVPDMGTSDRHVEFYYSMGNWYVRDVGGEGGLRVNGKVVHESTLADADDIRIGNSQLLFNLEKEDAEDEDWQRTSDLIRSESARVQKSLGAGVQDVPSTPPTPALAPVKESIPDPMKIQPTGQTKPKILEPLFKKSSDSTKEQSDEPDDLVWVSRQMASLLEDVLSRPASIESIFQRMLMRLRQAVDADYGFLMVPDPRTRRWVIRTQVGDSFSWTGYERAHPVPLSAATTAFKRKRAVSNAMADDPNMEDEGPSASMMRLRVNGYIAVPLLKGADCRGVLYFDTRDGDKEFRVRDVKLLEQAGAMMMEIEGRKQAGKPA